MYKYTYIVYQYATEIHTSTDGALALGLLNVGLQNKVYE